MSSKKERRARLWTKQNGTCHWCGVPMVMPTGDNQNEPLLATIDHLDDRYSGRRRQHNDGVARKVLACLRCNRERAQEAVSVCGYAQPPRRVLARSVA